MYAAYDIGYLNIEKFEFLKKKAEECSKLLNSFIKAVKTSPHGGLQRRKELTKREQDVEAFMTEARTKLAKIHPEIYGKK